MVGVTLLIIYIANATAFNLSPNFFPDFCVTIWALGALFSLRLPLKAQLTVRTSGDADILSRKSCSLALINACTSYFFSHGCWAMTHVAQHHLVCMEP